jgi:hypothetical protein
LGAFQRWQFQSVNLSSQQILKCHLRKEKGPSQTVSIPYRSSDIGVCEKLKRIQFVDGFDENLRKDILNASSTNNAVLRIDGTSFNELNEEFDVLVDEGEDEDSLRFLISAVVVLTVLRYFVLFRFQHENDTFADDWQFEFDVLQQNHVHRFYQTLNSHFISHTAVLLMVGEELLFCFELLFNGNV